MVCSQLGDWLLQPGYILPLSFRALRRSGTLKVTFILSGSALERQHLDKAIAKNNKKRTRCSKKLVSKYTPLEICGEF